MTTGSPQSEIFPATDPPHPRIARRGEPLPKTIQLLRSRRARLHRFLERTQEAIAAIEAELRRRGADPGKPPKIRPLTSPFSHGELPRICIGALRAAGHPLQIRDLAAAVLAIKRLTPDWKLTGATIKRARETLRLLRVKGIVRIVGGPVLRRRWWALVEV
jgi:hypothetical protein